jgi:hypothetical protein
MPLDARVTLKPSGRVVSTMLPRHPKVGEEMTIRDGDVDIKIRVIRNWNNPGENAIGPLIVDAVQI